MCIFCLQAKELPPDEEGTQYCPSSSSSANHHSRGHPSFLPASLSKKGSRSSSSNDAGPSPSTVFHLPGNTGTCRYMVRSFLMSPSCIFYVFKLMLTSIFLFLSYFQLPRPLKSFDENHTTNK